MFSSLKKKIKEETGSDITKLTQSWRTGGLISKNISEENGSRPGGAIMTEEEISAELESYLKDRMDSSIDQVQLEKEYTKRVQEQLAKKDKEWESKLQEMKLSLESTHAEELSLAMNATRTAQLEAKKESEARLRLEAELREAEQYKHARDRLQALGEELEAEQHQWAREKCALENRLSDTLAIAERYRRELELVRASLPPDHNHHRFDEDLSSLDVELDEASLKRILRERSVLARQLEEAQLALDDIKTSWSGQIATLETQVARVSRACGEEASERRRFESSLQQTEKRLAEAQAQLQQKQNAIENANAKIARLSSEVKELSSELKSLKMSKELPNPICTNADAELCRLRTQLECKSRECQERELEMKYLGEVSRDLREQCSELEAKVKRETLYKDDSLLRNAEISQSLELVRNECRKKDSEIDELKLKINELEEELLHQKQLYQECESIKTNESKLNNEINELRSQKEDLKSIVDGLQKKIEQVEAELTNSHRIIKNLQQRVTDTKKVLQREISQEKVTECDESEINRTYLKHVVMRLLTAHEVEARQLIRAVVMILRLDAHEEALLRSSLHPRNGFSNWFGLAAT